MGKRLLVVFVLLSFLAGTATPQNFSETVQVTVIEVPVTVVDRSGNPVRGLTREDFELWDDGKRIPLTGFDMLELSKLSGEPNKPLPPVAYRNFLLLFDLAHSQPGNIGRAQEAAREFVASRIERRDLVAVATFGAEQGLSLLTNFTSDRGVLDYAIRTLGAPSYFKLTDPLRIATPAESSLQQFSDSRSERLSQDTPKDALEELQRQMNRASAARYDDAERSRLRGEIRQFSGVARALDRLKGQKQVILLSEGFDPRLVQGRQDLSADATREQNAAVESGEIWKVDSDDRFGSAGSSKDIEDMATVFRRTDVTLHAIDIKGLRSHVDAAAGVQKSSNESLFLLARPTGGTVMRNSTDLTQNFTRLMAQQDVVYVLSFEARGADGGKYHKLKVKVPRASGARVQHRDGYYEPSSRISPREQNLTLAEIMMTDMAVRDVPLTLSALGLPSREGAGRIPVNVELPGRELLIGATGSGVTANLFVYAFDEQGQVHDFLQQRVAVDVVRSGEKLREAGMRFVGTLLVPPGKYTVKALVRVDETGKVGFVREEVVVPAGAAPAILPPVLLASRPNWINIAAPGRSADAVSAFSAMGQTFSPELRPTLAAPGAYRVALFLFETAAENLAITSALIGPDGAAVNANVSLVGRTEADAQGSAKLVLDFKPPALAAGDYRLQMTVKPEGRSESVVSLPFTVR